jgi:hypothetical protein
MTNFALTVYRRQTRAALERALGRNVSNKEQSDFIIRLQCEAIDPWIQEQANKEAFTITAKELRHQQGVEVKVQQSEKYCRSLNRCPLKDDVGETPNETDCKDCRDWVVDPDTTPGDR